jgi:AcrR family transcriptional regulator
VGVDTCQRLLIEARKSFAADGFDATTNKKLAQSVGITTAAIYHYFPSKIEMYVAVFTDVQDLVCKTIENSISKDADFSENISKMVDALAALTVREPAVVAFVMSVSSEAHRHPEVMKAVLPLSGRIGRILLDVCEKAVSRGEVSDQMSAQSLEDVLAVVLSGLARFNMVYKDARRTKELVNSMKLLLTGAALRVSTSV